MGGGRWGQYFTLQGKCGWFVGPYHRTRLFCSFFTSGYFGPRDIVFSITSDYLAAGSLVGADLSYYKVL